MPSIEKTRQDLTATSLAAWHTFCAGETMTAASEALDILESATVECKKRDINTPEVRDALDLLEPHIRPEWLIRQFRYHLDRDPSAEVDKEEESQQQASGNRSKTCSKNKWTPWRASSRRVTT